MGVFSTLRQMMLDAQRYRDSIAELRTCTARHAPSRNGSIARGADAGGRWTHAGGDVGQQRTRDSRVRWISRAEFKLRLIIAGGREADRRRRAFGETERAGVVSLNLPRRTTVAISEADPEPMRVLRERVEAQQTAGKLAKAGVRFAFQSGSMTNISDLLRNANITIENGLIRNGCSARVHDMAGRDIRR